MVNTEKNVKIIKIFPKKAVCVTTMYKHFIQMLHFYFFILIIMFINKNVMRP